MFRNLFNPESDLMVMLTRITDFLFLSLFWLLCCFPVVTIGPACAALYDTAVRSFRWGEKGPWRRYWHSFRQNLRVGIPATVIYGVCTGALVYGLIQVWNRYAAGAFGDMELAALFLLGMAVLGVLSVVFPLLSRFETTLGRLMGNALRLGLLHLPRSLGLGIATALTVFVCLRFVWPLFVTPCLLAWIASFLVEPMLKPYMPEEITQA